MKVRIIRAFIPKGGPVEAVGKVLDVADALGRELVAMGKAELVGDAPAQSGPMTTETTAELVSGKRKAQKE